MTLYKYFKKGGLVFPTLWTCGDSSLSGKDIQQANTEVLGESSGGPTRSKAVMPRGTYTATELLNRLPSVFTGFLKDYSNMKAFQTWRHFNQYILPSYNVISAIYLQYTLSLCVHALPL